MHRTPQQNHIPRKTCLEPRRRLRLVHAISIPAGILAVGIVVAGCGGGAPTRGVATVSASTRTSTSRTATSPAGAGTQATGLLAYASCMRSHGVANFPDPGSSGGIDKGAVLRALRAVSNSKAQAAQQDCQRLAGGGLGGQASKPVTAQQQHYYLSAAECMRSHGITNFPDPSFAGGGVQLPGIDKLDKSSAQFTRAEQICTKLIPAGLPHSGSKG